MIIFIQLYLFEFINIIRRRPRGAFKGFRVCEHFLLQNVYFFVPWSLDSCFSGFVLICDFNSKLAVFKIFEF